jgi:triacylglycerol lipase
MVTAKFNLVGHSQGSPTSRYAAAVRPDLVLPLLALTA